MAMFIIFPAEICHRTAGGSVEVDDVLRGLNLPVYYNISRDGCQWGSNNDCAGGAKCKAAIIEKLNELAEFVLHPAFAGRDGHRP